MNQACQVCHLKSKDSDNNWTFDSRYLSEPTAVETLGVFNTSANSLLKEIGLKISLNTRESRETSFLYQCISVLVQRFNAVLLHDSLPTIDCTTDYRTHDCLAIHNFLTNLRNFFPGFKIIIIIIIVAIIKQSAIILITPTVYFIIK